MSDGTAQDLTLRELANRIVRTIRQKRRNLRTEEDLRIASEMALAEAMAAIPVMTESRYERHGPDVRTVYSGRPDAVHGHVIMEYELPGSFRAQRNVNHAFEQLRGYIEAEASESGDWQTVFGAPPVGVGFDGDRIFFVLAYPDDAASPPIGYDIIGPFDFDSTTCMTLLTYLRSLARIPLNAENLVSKFGPGGPLASRVVAALMDALVNWTTPRVNAFFSEWQRLFGIVYGAKFREGQDEMAVALRDLYGLKAGADFQGSLFCVHTYFALLMKLIAIELLRVFEGTISQASIMSLANSNREALAEELRAIETGAAYRERGVINFVETDFFQWYLDAFSPAVADSVASMARELAQMESATSSISFRHTRDLLKSLYQDLVPQPVRKTLGEYYTPDWLADFVLDEIGYSGAPDQRLVDPACGSGTFLVLALRRMRSQVPPNQFPAAAVRAVWGFDLNPIAVIAARTNYIFALGGALDPSRPVELPVYLADSVLWPQQIGQQSLDTADPDSVPVQTSIGMFHVPRSWTEAPNFIIRDAASQLSDLVASRFTPEEACATLESAGHVRPGEQSSVRRFYSELLQAELDGRNGIWARFLKNMFAPVAAGKFDFVAGNPPWVRWQYLSDDYKRATAPLWKGYGLFSLKGHASTLGGGEKDFSALFTYAAADHFLADGGRLAFLVTLELLKSRGAGEGFRRFQIGPGAQLRVVSAHDFQEVKPFPGVGNKTAALVLEKGSATVYPVAYTVWRRRKGVGSVPPSYTWPEASQCLTRTDLEATPQGKPVGPWQTASPSELPYVVLAGQNAYRKSIHCGAYTAPYAVFHLEVHGTTANGALRVTNTDAGKSAIEVLSAPVEIEPDLVFPGVTGADISRWHARASVPLLVTQDFDTSEPYPESEMKRKYPLTYMYLTRFKESLLARGSKSVKRLAERKAFYAMFGIGPYTRAPYKVVWNRMGREIKAAVVSQQSLTGLPLPKVVVPMDTTAYYDTTSETEAHYLCALMNSLPLRKYLSTYTSPGRGLAPPSALYEVGIPPFEQGNQAHERLAELSRSLHAEATDAQGLLCGERLPYEDEVDAVAATVFGVRD